MLSSGRSGHVSRGRGGGSGRSGPKTKVGGRSGSIGGRSSNSQPLQLEELQLANNVGLDDAFSSDDDTSPEATQHTGRGSNIPQQLPIPANRTQIWIVGNQFNEQSDVSRVITDIIRGQFCGEWGTWTKVPQDQRDLMWGRFQGMYKWDDGLEVKIKGRFFTQISTRFRDMLSKARGRAIDIYDERSGLKFEDTKDYSLLFPYNPNWCRQSVWTTLCEGWNTDKWKAMSSTNSDNRSKSIGGHHTCGSVGFSTTRLKLDAELGYSIPSIDFFTHTHTKKASRPRLPKLGDDESGVGGVGEEDAQGNVLDWVNEKSRTHYEIYNGYMSEKYGDNIANHPKHDSELWDKAAPSKKGRTYGANGDVDPLFVFTGTPSTPSTASSYSRPVSTEEMEAVKRKLEDLEKERAIEKSERETERAEREAERVAREAEKAEREAERAERAEEKRKLAELYDKLKNT